MSSLFKLQEAHNDNNCFIMLKFCIGNCSLDHRLNSQHVALELVAETKRTRFGTITKNRNGERYPVKVCDKKEKTINLPARILIKYY